MTEPTEINAPGANIGFIGNRNTVENIHFHAPEGYYTVNQIVSRLKRRVKRANPHDFYNGTEARWLDIVAEYDASRAVTVEMIRFVEQYAVAEGKIPVGLLTARGGDGKSTILMRVAVDLAQQGYKVLWLRPNMVNLNSEALEQLEEDETHRIIICVDDAHQFPIQTIENTLRNLNQLSAHVMFLLTARQAVWFGQQPNLHSVCQLNHFTIAPLTTTEINQLLDKLTMAQELGQLAGLNRSQQLERFSQKAEGQLLVALLEAKYNDSFKSIVSRSLKDIQQKFGDKVATACYLVCAVHTFGLRFPAPMLKEILQLRSLQADIVAKTKGFLVAPQVGAGGLQSRHALIAEVIFKHDAGKYDRLADFIHHLPFEQRSVLLQLAYAIRLQFDSLALEIAEVRPLFKDANDMFRDIGKYIRHSWALLEKEAGNLDKARELFAKGAQHTPDAPLYQAWALLEQKAGNLDKARELFAKGLEYDVTHAPIYQAWALLEIGDVEKARELFAKGLEQDPKNAPSYQAWGLLEKEAGDREKARELFAKGLEQDPKHAPSYQAWGLLEKEAGDREKARELFAKGLEQDPKNAPIYQAWGLLEKEAGDREKARELFAKGLEQDPKNAPIYQAWGLLEKEAGDREKARELFAKGLEQDPKHAPIYQAWGLLEKEAGDREKARELFAKGLEQDPKHAPIYQAWGLLEKEAGDREKARELFAKGLEQDPKHAPIYQAWGLLEKEAGDREKARELFAKGLEQDPKHAPIYQAWGLLEKEAGDREKARELFAKGLEQDPKHAPIYQAWGLLEKEAGDREKARELFAKGLEQDPKHAPIYQAWGLLEKEAGDREKARELFAKGLEQDPKHAPSYQAWGLLEKEAGDREKARELFAKGLEQDPKNAPIYQAWGLLEKEAGDREKARELFAKGLEQDPKHAVIRYSWQAMEKEIGDPDYLAAYYQTVTSLLANPSGFWQPWALVEKSRGHYQKARELFAKATAYQPWAIMEKELGHYEQARELFVQATQADPTHAAAWQAWAIMEIELGHYESALAKAQQVVKLSGQNDIYALLGRGQAYQGLGETELAQADLAQARGILRRRLGKRFENTKWLNILGRVLTLLGHYSQAIAVLNLSMRLSQPGQIHFAYNGLGELYAAQGQFANARQQWQLALQSSPHYLPAKNNLIRYAQVENQPSMNSKSGSNGFIYSLVTNRKFGFILRTDGETIFFRFSNVTNVDEIALWMNVQCAVEQTPKGLQATNVKIL